MYRFLLVIGILAWFGLTFILGSLAQAQGAPLLLVRFSSVVVVVWLLTGIGFLLLGLLGVIRSRSSSEKWIARFESLSTYLNEGVLICDPRGRVRWNNEAGQDLLTGREVNEQLRTLLERVRESGRIAIQTVSLGEAQRYTVQALQLDRKTYALVCRPLQSGSTQNSFYENFIRRIVHDMRNPLAAIIGHAANMSQGSVEPDSWRKSATTIEAEAQRLSRLVDSILFDARLAYVPLSLGRLDLADLLEEAMFAQDERAAREGKTLAMDAPPGAMPLDGDHDLLVRAFENLVDNSLKYSGANGRVHLHLARQPNAYVVQVVDNGEGIPPEFLPDRVFEPLVRARSHGSGSGLGLSIVRKIIEMHGGTISAQSKVGVGTTMTVSLPIPGAGAAS